MSDELRAAAEAFVECIERYGKGEANMDDGLAMIGCGKQLADSYLAEHPADEMPAPDGYPGDDVARKVYGILMRRGWSMHQRHDGKWCVPVSAIKEFLADDPFTAVLNAEAWFVANAKRGKE